MLHIFVIFIILFTSSYQGQVEAKVDKCQADCRESSPYRLVGPTRPWFVMDKLGNELSLTRPYPYAFAGSVVDNLRFNLTFDLFRRTVTIAANESKVDEDVRLYDVDGNTFTNPYFLDIKSIEAKVVETVRDTLNATIPYFELEVFPSTVTQSRVTENITTSNHEVVLQIDFPLLGDGDGGGNGDSNTSTSASSTLKKTSDYDLQKLETDLNANVSQSGIISDTGIDMEHGNFAKDAGSGYTYHMTWNWSLAIAISSITDSRMLHAGDPNPYSAFCELGCSLFFSSPSDNNPFHINECTNKCDATYKYNISVGYNDLVEAARLECRDGCQIGLMRCQPGYFCSQVELKERAAAAAAAAAVEKIEVEGEGAEEGSATNTKFHGGIMAHCPAGTYRDAAYDAVEECIPCPPGRFREDIKGRSLESCSKCPERTYNSKSGSSTLKDCLRCPAGTFTNEPGSAKCICITPAACENEFPSPGDAEKRDTYPYIGFS